MKQISVILLLFIAGCGSAVDHLPADAFQAEADAVLALSFAAAPELPAAPSPAPDDDTPKPGKCDSCKGSGRSGDGIGRCGTCGGDGKIDERDILGPIGEAASTHRAIVMYTTDEANREGWPQRWWSETRPKLVADGWTVSGAKVSSGPARFEVQIGTNTKTLIGFHTYEDFE